MLCGTIMASIRIYRYISISALVSYLTIPTAFHVQLPWADIHEILMSDLLHQVIKGSFKDHLVEWVGKYLLQSEGKERAREIMDDIDCRYVFRDLS